MRFHFVALFHAECLIEDLGLQAIPDGVAVARPIAYSRLDVALREEELEIIQQRPADFEVSGALLDDFQLFLSQRNIQPGVGDWSRDRDTIRNRLKAEIFNQAFGVEKGDEVEAQRDALILKALEVMK